MMIIIMWILSLSKLDRFKNGQDFRICMIVRIRTIIAIFGNLVNPEILSISTSHSAYGD